jgi:ergothioneine biosynthesis protein EgtB
MARVLLSNLDCEENLMLSVRHPESSCGSSDVDSPLSSSRLAARFRQVRALTESLCAPLCVEDYGVQSIPEASPAKWHLAHTTWFFETFVLANSLDGYQLFHPAFRYLFNSYYEAVGERWPKAQRGLLSRPTVAEIYQYRDHVNANVASLVDHLDAALPCKLADAIVLGLHHEQQHQELLLTDIKHAFASNPMRPVYRESAPRAETSVAPLAWIPQPSGVRRIGHNGEGFAFDNEAPAHQTYLNAFAIADRLATNEEYLAFMEDGGYERPDLWLSDGWQARNRQGWTSPLYWERDANCWHTMTFSGMQRVNGAEPVCHLSFYEADAFARWSGARLPTEAEWEVVTTKVPVAGILLGSGHLHPVPATKTNGASQLFGDVWEWTNSAYLPYPGYRPTAGALGEYNGKFMCNQMVLRGGSCVTPNDHIRASYRNFFPPETRWQFTGVRLTRDA